MPQSLPDELPGQALDRSRRYLRPVARLQLADEPDLVHLAVYEWLPRFGEWATYATALCGHSTEQGTLPEGTEVNCDGCLDLQGAYELALDRQAARGLTRTGEADWLFHMPQDGSAKLQEVRELLSEWTPTLRSVTPVLFRKLDALLQLQQPEERP